MRNTGRADDEAPPSTLGSSVPEAPAAQLQELKPDPSQDLGHLVMTAITSAVAPKPLSLNLSGWAPKGAPPPHVPGFSHAEGPGLKP